MKRLFITALLAFSLSVNSAAFWSDFYLKTKTLPEKLLPDTLSVSIPQNEERSVFVDLIPTTSRCDIEWQISPAIATLSPRNTKCTLKARECGDATLTATAENGVTCSIKIKVIPPAREILLEGEDTVKSGESAVIYARPSSGDTVSWRVVGLDSSQFSFGGNLCKISPKKEGTVTVFATLDNTTVSKTMEVLPAKCRELDLGSLSFFLAGSGVMLLIIILLYGRGYEKEF